MPASRIDAHFAESLDAKAAARAALVEPTERAVRMLDTCLAGGGKILICGNGGSAADSQHFAAELIGRFEAEREELAAIALTTDSSILTAVANDYAYDEVFARQVRGLGREGDVLVAISTSGNSASIVRAVEAAHRRDVRVLALTGRDGGRLAAALGPDDIELRVPHSRTCRIQEVHLLLIHCLCDAIDAMRGLAQGTDPRE
ncbi:MAG: phosphoheptose isomerase [Burkholderiaceae bacterium]|nr:phosphoheptose isomerase [Burkholderiaceae bacterium]MEB2320413.1 phosphoheptose isomerase [Pseudomonadota bacterium]